MNDELKQIKKIYGEEMMHMCRELFPSILENEGKLLKILTTKLAPTHSFASDVKEANVCDQFKNWIFSLYNGKKTKLPVVGKTPFELMKEAGYTLYECKSEADIQRFKKYYKKNEELCTFHGGRLERCHVFFAVKDNVNEIKREDFPIPERQDEYGTSVISIQFARGEINTLSIKNRYNHTVENPDATFSNNLENIIPGLTRSFEENYNYNLKMSKDTNNEASFLVTDLYYVKANDGKYYRYNVEREWNYYCENNISVMNGGYVFDSSKSKEKWLLIDEYVLSLENKEIYSDVNRCANTSFTNSIMDVGKIKKIDIVKNGKNRIILFTYEDNKEVKIEINQNNAIIGYENKYIEVIGPKFLLANRELKWLSLPKVGRICGGFLRSNTKLERLYLPKVRVIERDFLRVNDKLIYFDMPKLEYIDGEFASGNNQIKSIYFPKLRIIGDAFMVGNNSIEEINLPKAEYISYDFLRRNNVLKTINIPNIKSIGANFLYNNSSLKSIDLPNLKIIGSLFLPRNNVLEIINIPNAIEIGRCFLFTNKILKNLNLPNVKKIDNEFLASNYCIKSIRFPKLKYLGPGFLGYNITVKKCFYLLKGKAVCLANRVRERNKTR